MSKLEEQDYQRLAEWGYSCYQQGDLPRARIVFSALLELKQGDSYAARGLAAVALQQGNSAEAIQLMAGVLERNPADLAAQLRLVEGLIDAGRLPDAQQGIASLRDRVDSAALMRLELRLRQSLSGQATSG